MMMAVLEPRLGMLLKLMESCIDGKGCRGYGGIKITGFEQWRRGLGLREKYDRFQQQQQQPTHPPSPFVILHQFPQPFAQPFPLTTTFSFLRYCRLVSPSSYHIRHHHHPQINFLSSSVIPPQPQCQYLPPPQPPRVIPHPPQQHQSQQPQQQRQQPQQLQQWSHPYPLSYHFPIAR